jgi:hypothetical protein
MQRGIAWGAMAKGKSWLGLQNRLRLRAWNQGGRLLAAVFSGLRATGNGTAKGLNGAKAIGRHCAPASVTISQLGAKCLTDLNFEGAGSSAIDARMSG